MIIRLKLKSEISFPEFSLLYCIVSCIVSKTEIVKIPCNSFQVLHALDQNETKQYYSSLKTLCRPGEGWGQESHVSLGQPDPARRTENALAVLS